MFCYLRKLVVFTILVGCILLLLDYSMDIYVDTRIERNYSDLIALDAPVDNIVIGTSTTAYGVNPLFLGGEKNGLYNFGHDAAGPTFFQEWYHLFKRIQRPPLLVLYGVDWFMFNDNNVINPAVDAEYYPVAHCFGLMASGKTTLESLLYNRFSILKDREVVLQKILRIPPKSDEVEVNLSKYFRGYAPFRIVSRGPSKPLEHWNFKRLSRRTSPEAILAFRGLLSEFRKDKVRVVFFQAPQYLPAVGEQLEKRRLLIRLAGEFNVPFLDYNGTLRSALNEDKTLFNDSLHLNEQGSAVFSRRLNQDLRARHIL